MLVAVERLYCSMWAASDRSSLMSPRAVAAVWHNHTNLHGSFHTDYKIINFSAKVVQMELVYSMMAICEHL